MNRVNGVIRGIVLLCLGALFCPVYGLNFMFEENFALNSNIFRENPAVFDLINRAGLTFSGQHPGKSLVHWWKFSARAENYLYNPSESNYLGFGFYKSRFKFPGSVLDFEAKLLYDYYPGMSQSSMIDNMAYSHLAWSGMLHYRLDFPNSSLHFEYLYSGALFPDYDLDNNAHSLGLLYSQDFSLFTTIDFKLDLLLKGYGERYLLDASGVAGNEAFMDSVLSLAVKLRHFFTPRFRMFLDLNYRRCTSNGNFYFYGPGESVLVSDGDEVLLNNFYSYNYGQAKIRLEYALAAVELQLGMHYGFKYYIERPPFNEAGEVLPGDARQDSISGFSMGVKWHLGKTQLLQCALEYSRIASNSYSYDTDVVVVTAGTQIWF